MKYPNYDDLARLEYGRMFWKNPRLRSYLLSHWLDQRHPYRERFVQNRPLIEEILESSENDDALDARLHSRGLSLRAVMREIPPVFGSFWKESCSAHS